MSGVTIGRVTDIQFDGESLEAVVTIVIDSRYDQIPDDSDARILTSGLLGSQYIGLQRGASETSLQDGGEIYFTQDSIGLEDIIRSIVAGSGSDD
jgi:phospholipid/cholesterol/gamma-HCH transport system substrate-binding protein